MTGLRQGEITAQSLPSKPKLVESSQSPPQACARVDHSQVQVCSEDVEDLGASDSFTCSKIPEATHFSTINFNSWAEMSNFWTGEGSDQVIGEPIPPETHLEPQSPALKSPEYDSSIYYGNIKWAQQGYYNFGACYYPRNWSTYVREKKKPTWSIRDNSEYGFLLRETLAKFKEADARLQNRKDRSSPSKE